MRNPRICCQSAMHVKSSAIGSKSSAAVAPVPPAPVLVPPVLVPPAPIVVPPVVVVPLVVVLTVVPLVVALTVVPLVVALTVVPLVVVPAVVVVPLVVGPIVVLPIVVPPVVVLPSSTASPPLSEQAIRPKAVPVISTESLRPGRNIDVLLFFATSGSCHRSPGSRRRECLQSQRVPQPR